jgi:DNA-3-methyladenine glycosylase
VVAPAAFFAGPAEAVAPELLGWRLLSLMGGVETSGRIVEVEAYVGPHDPASHAAERIGRTLRNEAMFGPPGTAYVYFTYGMHWCLNVVTGAPGDPQAVLIRALEPESGMVEMARRRGRDRDLANGPARLCQALGVEGSLDGHDLSTPPLLLLPGSLRPGEEIAISGRIGVRHAADWPLRFFLRGHPHLSSGRPAPIPRARRS